ESACCGASAGRSLSNKRCERVRNFAFNALSPGPADQANRSDCLCASWQLPPQDNHAPGPPGMYPSALSLAHSSLDESDSRTCRDEPPGDTVIRGNWETSEDPLLRSSAAGSPPPLEGTGTGRRARARQIRPSCT